MLDGMKLLKRIFQRLSGFERRHLCGGDLDGLAGVRVAACAGGALPRFKAAEAGKLYLVVLLQGLLHRAEKGVQYLLGVLLAHACGFCDSRDQFRFVHVLVLLIRYLFSRRWIPCPIR